MPAIAASQNILRPIAAKGFQRQRRATRAPPADGSSAASRECTGSDTVSWSWDARRAGNSAVACARPGRYACITGDSSSSGPGKPVPDSTSERRGCRLPVAVVGGLGSHRVTSRLRSGVPSVAIALGCICSTGSTAQPAESAAQRPRERGLSPRSVLSRRCPRKGTTKPDVARFASNRGASARRRQARTWVRHVIDAGR